MNWIAHLKILPLLVVVAALSFGVRFGEFVTGVSQTNGAANAQEQSNKNDDEETAPDAGEASEKMDDGEKESSLKKEMIDGEQAEEKSPTDLPTMEEGEEINWRDSTESEFELSSIRVELFEDLKNRRESLNKQQRELSVREALLKTAEQELDQKYKELLSLKSEIESLLVQQSDEEKERVASLVKIYEGMKPKDAARIFNTLDLDILLSVVSQMSERKSAPIIASMSPERARTLTTMLIDQKTLGDISAKIQQ